MLLIIFQPCCPAWFSYADAAFAMPPPLMLLFRRLLIFRYDDAGAICRHAYDMFAACHAALICCLRHCLLLRRRRALIYAAAFILLLFISFFIFFRFRCQL